MFIPGSRLTGREPAAWRTSRGAAGSRNAVAAAAAIKGGKNIEETPRLEKVQSWAEPLTPGFLMLF